MTLILELLAWLASGTRTYRETMEAWRTSCPRFPVWEDATDAGFVALVRADDGVLHVALTPVGRAALDGR
jgi:hypothetical protein